MDHQLVTYRAHIIINLSLSIVKKKKKTVDLLLLAHPAEFQICGEGEWVIVI
jgi:hypothetical protein